MKFYIVSITLLLIFEQLAWVAMAEEPEKIIGGEETDKDRYPYQVALVDGTDGRPYCGGSLVNASWVLSAAHCCGYGSHVLIGRHDFSADEAYETIEIEWETPHPDYDAWSIDNDYMMIKLKEESTYDIVSLDSGEADLSEGVAVTVMGWGVTESGSTSNVLMEVSVDMVSNENCNSAYDGGITSNMMCAAKDGKDSCQGDSGGPLITKGAGYSDDVLVGIVSWGRGCAEEGYPGVYARVNEKYDWINDQMANGVAPDEDDTCGGNYYWSDEYYWGDWCSGPFSCIVQNVFYWFSVIFYTLIWILV